MFKKLQQLERQTTLIRVKIFYDRVREAKYLVKMVIFDEA